VILPDDSQAAASTRKPQKRGVKPPLIKDVETQEMSKLKSVEAQAFSSLP
jgi:hypothetical protein